MAATSFLVLLGTFGQLLAASSKKDFGRISWSEKRSCESLVSFYEGQDFSFLLAQDPWDYERRGPEAWPYLFPECKKTMQSPIDIIPRDTYYNPNLRPFKFFNYDAQVRWNVSNTENASKYSE